MLIDDSFIYNLHAEVLKDIAGSDGTPSLVLRKLAKNNSYGVRASVASNPNTLPLDLIGLAADWKYYVRWRVAENPNTPIEALEVLANDETYTVLRSVVSNPKTPSSALEKIINKDFSNYEGLIEFDINALIKAAKEHPNYKKSINLNLSQSQLEALKNLIEASSNPHLQELFNGIS